MNDFEEKKLHSLIKDIPNLSVIHDIAYQGYHSPYRDAGKILEKALIGTEIHDERWRECVRDTDKTLGFAVGAMFIESSFNGSSKDVAEDMVDRVKKAFKVRLQDLSELYYICNYLYFIIIIII